MTITRSIALAAALGLTAMSAPATTTINIIGFSGPGAFNPNPVTIASGDSVAWTNNDFTTHHIVLDDGTYDSGDLNPGSSSVRTAALIGSATYHCIIHPSMVGTITVNAPCSYALSAASASVGAGGAAGAVSVTAAAGCAWTAVSNNGFITVLSGATGTGNGSVGYSVAANPTPSPRSGTITIAGQTFTITQAGAVCVPITLSPATLANVTLGVPTSVTLTPSGGAAPYAFAVAGGALPAGLTLSSAGVLAGTPTVAGTSNFTVRVTEGGGCFSDVAYALTVLVPVPALPLPWLGLLTAALIALASWTLARRRDSTVSQTG